MLIAFISDIHGNMPALRAALADIQSSGVTTVIGAGDYVGYGPFSNDVCEYLQASGMQCISGNYDRKVLSVIEGGESAVAKLQKKKRQIVIATAEELGKNARRFLSELPPSLEVEAPGGKRALVVHGSPISDDHDILPSITARGLNAMLGDVRPDILVCGHTHIPFVKKVAATLVVNCGSTGQPVDGDPSPSYAILSVEESKVTARVVRFSYDVEETIGALKKSTLPKGLQKDFKEGTKRRFLE